MATAELDIDYVLPPAESPEQQMHCAILNTFFEDIDHIQRTAEKFKGAAPPKHYKYSSRYPFIELHSLISELNSDWTRVICDHADIDYGFFRRGVVNAIKAQLNRLVD